MNRNFLISGDDQYRKEAYLSFLKDTKEIKKGNIEIFDAAKVKEFNISSFFHTLSKQSLFSDDKRLVIVKDAYFLSSLSIKGLESELDFWQKQMHEYLEHSNEQVVLVFYMDKLALDGRKKIVKFLQAEKIEWQDFKALKTWEFPQYAKECLKKENLYLSEAAFNELLYRINADSMLLQKAIELLKLVPSEEYNLQDIEERISYSLNVDIFSLANVFLEKNLAKTWHILKHMQKANIDSQAQIALLASRIRNLYDMKQLSELGYDNISIAQKLKVKNFAVQKGLSACLYQSANQLLAILKDLADLDQNIKQGKIEAKLGFEQLILRNGK